MPARSPAVIPSRADSPAPRASFAWALLSVSGIAFWFFLGFPFAHHNESYLWVAWIDTPDLRSFAWHHFFGAGGYRPLAMTVAWALYRAAHGGLVPIQLFNFLTTAFAWWVLCRATNAPRTFALCALVSGGVLFSGYIYLFHLHGVFYGPMLLWLAWAIRGYSRGLTRNALVGLSLGALLCAMFHPYTVVFGLALVAGAMIELGWLRNPRARWFAVAAAIAGAILIVALSPPNLLSETGPGLRALMASFRATEANGLVSAVCLLLSFATVAGTDWGRRATTLRATLALGLGALACALVHIPFVVLWLAASLVKACVHRRWTLALLLVASLGLPYAGGTGSPTYAVFALAVATVVTAVDWAGAEETLLALRPIHAVWVTCVLVVLVVALRAGIRVPLISAVARPVLAESERTHQLDRLLHMLLSSPWRSHPVMLATGAPSPTESEGGLDRAHRPPTQQMGLDAYLFKMRGAPDHGVPPIVVSFGGGRVSGENQIWVVPGKYAGDAVAALPARLDSARAR